MSDSIFTVQAINRHRLTVDGKGVTTLVGLFGCPLKCKYCLNMDILSTKRARRLSPEKLWEELSIDYCYYVASGGGITFGGGESLLHSKAIMDFIDILPEGVSVNLETSLNVPLGADMFLGVIGKVLATGGQLIIDTKALDSELYKKYTGLGNDGVQRKLSLIVENGYASQCMIRVPIIPDFKDKNQAEIEAEYYRNMGFEDIDVFEYIIKDYMKK